MRYGFVIPTGGPREVAELARELEESGWDGTFYWDGISIGKTDTYDPWVVMAAMAMRTERVRIGTIELLVFAVLDSTPGGNRFGPNPKTAAA